MGRANMNAEGYRDPTAEAAIQNVRKKKQTPEHVMDVVRMIRDIAWTAGFEVIGRVQLRDRTTGKEYK